MATKQVQKTKGPINAEMTIAEIFEKHPNAVSRLTEKMLEYGLHCTGCHANQFESLGDGAMGHGMSMETFKEMLGEVNKIVLDKTKEPAVKDIGVTERAAEKIKELIRKEKKKAEALRVRVVKGGCAGQSYDLSFDSMAGMNDIVVNSHGVKIFIDPESLKFVKGAEIDYTEGLQGTGFKVNNPNMKKSCGCGNSFS